MTRQGPESALIDSAKWTAIDGLKIRYVEDGRRNGPDTLLLAPWPEGLSALDSIWEAIVATGRVVAVELPGLGLSEACEALEAPDQMAVFVMKVIESFRLRHPHLIGGNAITACVLCTVLTYPGAVESLILVEGAQCGEKSVGLEDGRSDFETAQLEAWSGILPKLNQISTPVLIISEIPASDGKARALKKRLPKSRLIEISDEGASEEIQQRCCQLVEAWIGGAYRSGQRTVF